MFCMIYVVFLLTGPLLLYTEKSDYFSDYNPQPADANMEGFDQTVRSVRVFFRSTKMSTSFLRESRHAKRENIAERLCERLRLKLKCKYVRSLLSLNVVQGRNCLYANTQVVMKFCQNDKISTLMMLKCAVRNMLSPLVTPLVTPLS